VTTYVVYSRRGRHVITTHDEVVAKAWRLATGGRIVPIERQPTVAELFEPRQVAA
jgi:hypothetical protein